jgi:hypothetical protein
MLVGQEHHQGVTVASVSRNQLQGDGVLAGLVILAAASKAVRQATNGMPTKPWDFGGELPTPNGGPQPARGFRQFGGSAPSADAAVA